MKKSKKAISLSCIGLMLLGSLCLADNENQSKQFTFSWQFLEKDSMKPRGGTTKGEKITLTNRRLDGSSNEAKTYSSKFEQDRFAILSMAGNYRVSFDFLETILFEDNLKPDKPYQSWGTEYVFVVRNEPTFISLQHILVMFFKNPDGSQSEPMIMKHWRQDWSYEKKNMHVFNDNLGWSKENLSDDVRKGKWSQSVHQVDDSPRYESYGEWKHENGFSTWISATTKRPLPRREFSVRDDYHFLEGTNRVSITPSGWIQEEDNLKIQLTEDNGRKAIAREAGIARYELVSDLEVKAAVKYWEKTHKFWESVRQAWDRVRTDNDFFTLKKTDGYTPMYVKMFERAGKLDNDKIVFDKESTEAFINETIERYLLVQNSE